MLVKQFLQSGLRPMFDPATMPGSNALNHWIDAYIAYASTANAGVVIPALIKPAASQGGSFFDLLEISLATLWTTALWTGPGATGVTAFIPPLSPQLRSVGLQLISSKDAGLALQLITEALHTYTLGVIVTVTTAGVAAPVPLT